MRTVFVIGPDKKIKLHAQLYPMSTGRNFDEVLRVLDSIQLTATHKVATPVNWKHGDDVIILPAVSDEEAKQKYPGGWKAPKPYLRIVARSRKFQRSGLSSEPSRSSVLALDGDQSRCSRRRALALGPT